MRYFGFLLVLPDYVRFTDFYANILDFTPISFPHLCISICRICLSLVGGARMLRDQAEGWDVRLGNKRNNFAWAGKTI